MELWEHSKGDSTDNNTFSACEYNNAYKHNVDVDSTSPFASGYFGLNPVAIVNSSIDNWISQNGYNGPSILIYDTSVDALQRTNETIENANGITLKRYRRIYV